VKQIGDGIEFEIQKDLQLEGAFLTLTEICGILT